MEKCPHPAQASNRRLQRISDVSDTQWREVLRILSQEGGQTSQDCRRESRDTNHKSLASMGNCTSERREPNLLRGTRQRRNGSSQHTLSLGWRRDLGIVLGYLGDRTPRSRTVPIGDLLVRVVPTVACHVCPFSGVVGCICSHLCCLFAFCVEENKNENKTNNNDGGVCW